MDWNFNVWENSISILSLIISIIVAWWLYQLSQLLSAKDKFAHEQKMSEAIKEIPIYQEVVLVDVKKVSSKSHRYF